MNESLLNAQEKVNSKKNLQAITSFYCQKLGSFDFRNQVLQLLIHNLFPMTQVAYRQIHNLIENLIYVYFFD